MYSCSPLFSAQVIFWSCFYFPMCEPPKDLPCKYLFSLLLNSSKIFASFGKEFPRLLLPPAHLISKLRSTSLLSPSLRKNCSKTSCLQPFSNPLCSFVLLFSSVLDTSAGFQWSWTDVFWFVLLFWVQPNTDTLMEASMMAPRACSRAAHFMCKTKLGLHLPGCINAYLSTLHFICWFTPQSQAAVRTFSAPTQSFLFLIILINMITLLTAPDFNIFSTDPWRTSLQPSSKTLHPFTTICWFCFFNYRPMAAASLYCFVSFKNYIWGTLEKISLGIHVEYIIWTTHTYINLSKRCLNSSNFKWKYFVKLKNIQMHLEGQSWVFLCMI